MAIGIKRLISRIQQVNARIDALVVGVSSVFGRTGAVVAATNDYTWAQVDKTTSSIADITTRSAGDLSSGTLAKARGGAGADMANVTFPSTGTLVTRDATETLTNKSIAETQITFTDITTGNAGTGQHGYLPKLGGGTANFLRADGTWSAPAGGTSVGVPDWNNAAVTDFFTLRNNGGTFTLLDTDGTTKLDPSATSGNDIAVYSGANSFGGSAIFEAIVKMSSNGTANSNPWIGFASTDFFSEGAGNRNHPWEASTTASGGFQNNGTTRRVVNSNGAGSTTATNHTTDMTVFTRYRVIRNGATNIEFLMNGTSIATHTTNLPGTTSLDAGCCVKTEGGQPTLNVALWGMRVR